MAEFTCKCCGTPLTLDEGQQAVECPFCKTKLTLAELEADTPAQEEGATAPLADDVPKVVSQKPPKKSRLSTPKKRLLCVILAAALLLGLVFGFKAFSSPPPQVEEIYDRVVELIESAHHFNTILYGKGLPTYAKDSEYAEINHLYFQGNGVPLGYLVVSDYSMYTSIDQMKAEAETIYSREWLNSVMYPAIFDGYVSDDGSVAHARYYEANNWIYMFQNPNNDFLKNAGMRLYDYATMQIIDPSNSEQVIVQMDSWLSSNPSVVAPATVSLLLQDGQWYLHSFTG